jgi:hypothetical protein
VVHCRVHGAYPELYESSSYPPILLFKIHFNVILQSTGENSVFPTHASSPVHRILRHLITVKLFGGQHKFSMFILLPPPVTAFLFFHASPSAPCSQTPTVCVLNVICETKFCTHIKQRIQCSSHQLEDEKAHSKPMGSKRSSNLTCS